MKRIGIIGGGASGIIAAISAARSDSHTQVFILEHKDTIGKKILATGNGRCNLTNQIMEATCYHSENISFVEEVLNRFGYQATLDFFHSLGLITKSRGNYIYPRSDPASSVLDLLILELKRLGVQIYTGVHVTKLEKSKRGFRVYTKEQTFQADKVILACGGKASSALGSDGSGYSLARSMGHSIIPVVPALVQLKVQKHPFAKASGVRTDARVTAYVSGNELGSDTGELQITAYGISGIPVFQISRYIANGLYNKQNTEVHIDFLPDITHSEFRDFLFERKNGHEDMYIGDYLTGIFNKKLIPRLLEQAHIRIQTKVGDLTHKQLQTFVDTCKKTVLTISDTNGFENAQICAGGVCTEEIYSATMESKYVEGLYLTGELLDVDGICGGYNLQWAWATGYLAGGSAAS